MHLKKTDKNTFQSVNYSEGFWHQKYEKSEQSMFHEFKIRDFGSKIIVILVPMPFSS